MCVVFILDCILLHCMKIASFDVGIKNLAFCIADGEHIIQWEVVDISSRGNNDMCKQVVLCLDKFACLLDVDTILIEKQPSKNNKMRIVESLINAYFVIKGSLNEMSPVKKVCVYSAKHKLGASSFKGKQNYRERKKLGVTRCAAFIENTEQDSIFKERFKLSKKKDDLADCLLQLLSYINCNYLKELEHTQLDSVCKIVARKPTAMQLRKMYSKSNLKHFFAQCTEIIGVRKLLIEDLRVKRAVEHWYRENGIEQALREMELFKDSHIQ